MLLKRHEPLVVIFFPLIYLLLSGWELTILLNYTRFHPSSLFFRGYTAFSTSSFHSFHAFSLLTTVWQILLVGMTFFREQQRQQQQQHRSVHTLEPSSLFFSISIDCLFQSASCTSCSYSSSLSGDPVALRHSNRLARNVFLISADT